MKKVWKAGIAGLAALSIGAAGFVGTTAAFAVDGDATGETQPVTTPSITITNAVAGHTYDAYQVFDGDLYGTTLSNIVWGSAVNVASVTASLDLELPKGITAPTDKTAKGWAEWLTDHNNDSAYAKAFATAISSKLNTTPTASSGTFNEVNKTYSINLTDPGYYLVKDHDDSLTDQNDQAYTSLILKVVGNVTVSPKSKVPTVDKFVEDEKNDNDASEGTDFGYSADHTLNKTFQFKLVANVPANADRADYDSYMVRFNDTMSNGITLEQINSVTVTGKDVDGAAASIIVSDYVLKGANGAVLPNPLKPSQAGGSFSLEIADLLALTTESNKKLDITKDIDITVLYNAHLNENAIIANANDTDGTKANPNTVNLSYSNNPNGAGTGTTADKKVYVYSFDMDATKVDKTDTTKKLAGAEFELYKDSNATDKIKLASVGTDKDGVAVYRVATDATTDDKIVTPESGKFNIQGLDNGTYYLKETKAPNGYNLPSTLFDFTITATHTTDDARVPRATLTNGKVSINLENTSGSQLPSTGGMGTTMLYVAGGAIVLIAGIGMAVALRRRQA